jgi:quercetin dioxygenase-like cupin family protein
MDMRMTGAIDQGEFMEVVGAASRASMRGPADSFTGEVWVDEIAVLPDPGLVRSLRVRFSPGARTAWHAHPLGQVLHVLDGVGRVQAEGGPVVEMRPGDTVVAGPGEMHWHGAAPDRVMSHIAIQERDPATGETTIWSRHVSDEDYLATPAAGEP